MKQFLHDWLYSHITSVAGAVGLAVSTWAEAKWPGRGAELGQLVSGFFLWFGKSPVAPKPADSVPLDPSKKSN